MSREDDRVSDRPLAHQRRRARYALRDLRWSLRPRQGPLHVLCLFGAQRSGTTMLLDEFASDGRVKVFDEYSALNRPAPEPAPWWDRKHVSRYDMELLPLPDVLRRLDRVGQPLAVSKPLIESHRAAAILDAVPHSAGVWLIRDVLDVAGSNLRKFGAATTVGNLRPIVEDDPEDWRNQDVHEETRALVRRHYDPAMRPEDAGALFWYVRNRLYLDLGLHDDPRMLLMRYEDLVADPAGWVLRCYDHVGVPRPDGYGTQVHRHSIGRAQDLALDPEVAQACADLQARFDRIPTVLP